MDSPRLSAIVSSLGLPSKVFSKMATINEILALDLLTLREHT
jgi:hypothetical protein